MIVFNVDNGGINSACPIAFIAGEFRPDGDIVFQSRTSSANSPISRSAPTRSAAPVVKHSAHALEDFDHRLASRWMQPSARSCCRQY